MLTKTKVLIIKLGHSETLDPEISKECSLGDVVRSTVLLNYFKDSDNVTWLCDEAAEPLLLGNPYIDRVLTWSFETALLLQKEYFDIVINLEKSPGVCALVEGMTGYQKFGFRLSVWHGKAEAYQHTEKVLEICYSQTKRDKNQRFWQEHLARVIDKRWSLRDTYIMPPLDAACTKVNVGLNFRVGPKWPDKAWTTPAHVNVWRTLEQLCTKEGLSVSLQPDLCLKDYMQWINSCETIVSCDSLGMHLSIAYGIPVVALFGPTSSTDVYFYGKGTAIQAEEGKMSNITVEQVFEELLKLRKGKTNVEAC